MSETNWASFATWEEIKTKTNCGLDSPFVGESLTEDSIYLWNQISVPLPSGSTNGVWGIFPDPKALTGFLRYIVFPSFFEIWLVRKEWDQDHEKFISAEKLFDLAEQSGKCRYIEDVPIMKTLIAGLDELMDQDNAKVRVGLKDIANKLNDRWENTPTWGFKVEVCDDSVTVGKEIFRRVAEHVEEEYIEEEFGMSENKWMEICKKVFTDKSAKEQFTEKLFDSGWI